MLVIETRPIFSVTATERSFVLGVIRLEKRYFAATLAQKAAGRWLPAELLALVEEQVFEHYWARTTAKSWERMDPYWRDSHPGLYWERFMTGSALRTWCKLADSLNLTLAAREGPHDKRLGMTSRPYNDTSTKPFVVHIARAGAYSHGNIALRASSALFPTTLSHSPVNDTAADTQYSLSVARLRGGTCSTNTDLSRGTCSASFVPAPAGGVENHLIGHDRVERYFDLDGLEDEITAWDKDSVQKCIAVLELEVLGGVRPKLRLVQSFASDGLE